MNTRHVRTKNNITKCTVGSITQERRGESKVLVTGGKQIISKLLVAGSLGRIHSVSGYNSYYFQRWEKYVGYLLRKRGGVSYTKWFSPFKRLMVREYVSYSIHRWEKKKRAIKPVYNGLFSFLFYKYNFIASGRFK